MVRYNGDGSFSTFQVIAGLAAVVEKHLVMLCTSKEDLPKIP